MAINFAKASDLDLEQVIKETLAPTPQMIESTIGIFRCRLGMGFSSEKAFWHALDVVAGILSGKESSHE